MCLFFPNLPYYLIQLSHYFNNTDLIYIDQFTQLKSVKFIISLHWSVIKYFISPPLSNIRISFRPLIWYAIIVWGMFHLPNLICNIFGTTCFGKSFFIHQKCYVFLKSNLVDNTYGTNCFGNIYMFITLP